MAPPLLSTRPSSPATAAATPLQAPQTGPTALPDAAATQGHRRAASPPAGLPPRAPRAGQATGASGVASAPKRGDVKLLFSPHKRAELREAKHKRAEHGNPQQLREQAAVRESNLPGVRAAEAAMAGKLRIAAADGSRTAPAALKNMKNISATPADVSLAATTAARLFGGNSERAAAAASTLVGLHAGATGAADAGARADAFKLLRTLAGNPHPSGAQAAARLIGTGGHPSAQTLAQFAAVADAVDPKRKARDASDLAVAVNRAREQAGRLPGAAEALNAAKFNLSSRLTDQDAFVPAAHSPWSAQGSQSDQDAPAVDGRQSDQARPAQRDGPNADAAASQAPLHPYVILSVAAMAIDLSGPGAGTVFEESDIDAALKSLRQAPVDKRFQVGALSA